MDPLIARITTAEERIAALQSDLRLMDQRSAMQAERADERHTELRAHLLRIEADIAALSRPMDLRALATIIGLVASMLGVGGSIVYQQAQAPVPQTASALP